MKALAERMALRALRNVDPETAHGLALKALHSPFADLPGPVTSPRLATSVAGMRLPNPVGLAAGFDKNATALGPLMKAGFGFLEVGAATPKAQPGNPKPRLFRLTEDQAAINRFGFNNDGMSDIVRRLSMRPAGIAVGLNLGANKDSADRAADFATVLTAANDHVDFAAVNVSSPNTGKLRDLQGAEALAALLDGVMAVRGDVPVFLKIAPDLTPAEIEDVANIAARAQIAGIIATNTTLDRAGLHSRHAAQTGGLSGQPLFEKSTRVLAHLSELTELPIIGVGGVASAEQALAKIQAGAEAVQLYTGMVYGGLSLARRIARDLDALLHAQGFANVSDAVGTDKARWL